MNLTDKLKKNIINIPGWTTKKKIIVIESDDWGSVAMPSTKDYNYLLNKGLPIDKDYFAKYDCLESEDDLNELFNVLLSFKDKNGNHPCITACTIVANPDFDKIKESNWANYYYEPFTKTYLGYPNHTKSFEIWKKGLENHLLWPQFHGREHLNPIEWLKVLKTDNHFEKLAFDNKALIGLPQIASISKRQNGYLGAFDYNSLEELQSFEQVINEGLSLFQSIFGFKSTSFIAPTSIRSDKIDQYLYDNGIKFHQLASQWLPKYEADNVIRQRYWGAQNKFGQTYWRRNATFEPSKNWQFDWINSSMFEIETAFRWHKPAVINSHRVNYIGGIDKENRGNSLKLLKKLLKKIIDKYPEVEFMSSDQLGEEILNNHNYFLGVKVNKYNDIKFKRE